MEAEKKNYKEQLEIL